MPTATFSDTAHGVRDWLRNHAAVLGVDAARIDHGTKPGTDPQIVVKRIGGGDDRSEVPLDVAWIQIDVWASGLNQAVNIKNVLRGLLKDMRTTALSSGVNATTAYGAHVLAEIFLPDEEANASRFALTVEVTARAT